MNRKSVVVLPYDEKWERDFHEIERELKEALGSLALRIEHVGSTSVKGLSAKPIIDIDAVISDYSVFPAVVEALAKIGYQHEGDLGIKEREAFKYSGKEHLRRHHLYVCPEASRELRRHVTFRDYLRSHPEAAAEYGRVKEEAARLFPDDMDKYIEYKSPCVEEFYKQAGLI